MANNQLTDEQKVGELELLLLATEAVVGEMEEYCDGTTAPAPGRLHALQIAATELLGRGLTITGAR